MEAVIEKAGVERLDGWMALVRRVRDEFPGLETEELLDEHRRTVEKFMRRGEAICAVQCGMDRYDPALIGYRWDDENPRIQLEPRGERGYIELRAVHPLAKKEEA